MAGEEHNVGTRRSMRKILRRITLCAHTPHTGSKSAIAIEEDPVDNQLEEAYLQVNILLEKIIWKKGKLDNIGHAMYCFVHSIQTRVGPILSSRSLLGDPSKTLLSQLTFCGNL